MGDVNFQLGGLAEFVYRRLIEFLGKDETSEAERAFLRTQIGIAEQSAATVQCVGMPNPISISDIYQQTSLTCGDREFTITDLMWEGWNALIFARPGQGKSTLLKWAYSHLAKEKHNWRPFLCILRNPDAVSDLETLVSIFAKRSKSLEKKKERIALLCDGYDELPIEERRRVSKSLQSFAALNCGNYYLTCRTFYDVFELKARQFQVAEFDYNRSEKFIEAFSRQYRLEIPAKKFLDDLHSRQFGSFTRHPLLLTLVCFLQSGSKSKLPANSIGLLRRSFEYMRYRWDKEKGVERESTVPLDAEEHEHILKKIAYAMDRDVISDDTVKRIVRQHLELIQYKHVQKSTLLLETEVQRLLMDLAKFYGMLVPTSSSYWGSDPKLRWEFTHNVLRDFLAASHWHQEIGFRPEKVHNWNLKAAYTTCLLSDATVAMETALDKCSDVFAISECLINGAKFTSSRVAAALLQHFEKYYSAFTCTRTSDRISYETSQDIFGLLTDEMLKNILRLASEQEACETADFCLAYAAHESLKRKLFLVPEYKRAMRQRLGCSTWVQRSYEWQRVSVEMN